MAHAVKCHECGWLFVDRVALARHRAFEAAEEVRKQREADEAWALGETTRNTPEKEQDA